jgi:hypothetical protein
MQLGKSMVTLVTLALLLQDQVISQQQQQQQQWLGRQ